MPFAQNRSSAISRRSFVRAHVVRLAVLPLLLAAGCAVAGPPKVGQVITVRGNIHLKGNQPFYAAVLTTPDAEWDLLGMDRAQMLAWQSRQATVRGRVLSLSGNNPAVRAQLDVLEIR